MEIKKAMKTVTEIKKEINKIIRLNISVEDKKIISAANSKLVFLKKCQLYLESNPRQEFVESELQKINILLDRIDDEKRFKEWKISNPKSVESSNDVYAAYLKANNRDKLIEKRKFVLFILE